ncbi:hypothetical protein A5719_29845 [Mycolicibacterium peregrinum]|nr:hypothetical protein A5719_29845 [Mycolicibacterium peregrinum]
MNEKRFELFRLRWHVYKDHAFAGLANGLNREQVWRWVKSVCKYLPTLPQCLAVDRYGRQLSDDFASGNLFARHTNDQDTT